MNIQSLLTHLVAIPSVTDSPQESQPLERIKKTLIQYGIQNVKIVGSGYKKSLIARIGTGDPILLFNSHIDVVPADEGAFEPRMKGDILFGRGAADAKGPLVAMLSAFLQLASGPLQKQIILCCVSDEENAGHYGTEQLVQSGVEAPFVIIGEPTKMIPIIAEKGFLRFRIDIDGKASHAAFPEHGINALEHANKILNKIITYNWDVVHPLLKKPTIAPTLMQAGEKINVIPSAASISFDMRYLPQQNEQKIFEIIHQLCSDVRYSISVIDSGAAFQTAPASQLVQIAADISGNAPEGIAFGTDARFYTNCDRIVMGPGDPNNAHTTDEHISMTSVGKAALVYKKIADQLIERV